MPLLYEHRKDYCDQLTPDKAYRALEALLVVTHGNLSTPEQVAQRAIENFTATGNKTASAFEMALALKAIFKGDPAWRDQVAVQGAVLAVKEVRSQMARDLKEVDETLTFLPKSGTDHVVSRNVEKGGL